MSSLLVRSACGTLTLGSILARRISLAVEMARLRATGKREGNFTFVSMRKKCCNLTVLLLQSVALELVGLVLGLLLEPAGAAGQLVLLLARVALGAEGGLARGRQLVDGRRQLVQLAADGGQLFGVGRQVVAVAAAGLAAAMNEFEKSLKKDKPIRSLTCA